jgi:hypothetical protein
MMMMMMYQMMAMGCAHWHWRVHKVLWRMIEKGNCTPLKQYPQDHACLSLGVDFSFLLFSF